MSEEQPKYSDLEDGIDYRVIKSYGRATRTSIRKSFVYALVLVIVIFLMTRCDGGQVSNLETKVINLETKVTNLETKENKGESPKSKGESQKNNAESQP